MTISEILAALPPDALVPVSWLREQLEAKDVSSLYTVARLAARLSRSPSTVRGWCEGGRFIGAFKLNGRDWRVPAAAVEAFLGGQERQASVQTSAMPRRLGRAGLGAWKWERAAGRTA